MKKLLILTSVLEIVAGLIVLATPALAVRVLLGVEIEGAGIIMSRIAGVALVGLGVACWPRSGDNRRQLYGMLTYSVLITLYFIRIGIRGAPVGLLLWPAVAVHAVFIFLLILAGVKQRRPTST